MIPRHLADEQLRTADELRIHNMRGAVFEAYVISGIYKQIVNNGYGKTGNNLVLPA